MGEGSLEVRRDTYPRLQDTDKSCDFSMNMAICFCSFKRSPKVAAAVLRRATAQGTEGIGRKYFVNFAKDGVLKMLAMQLL